MVGKKQRILKMDVTSGFEKRSQCWGALNLHSRWWPAEGDSAPGLCVLTDHFPDKIMALITSLSFV